MRQSSSDPSLVTLDVGLDIYVELPLVEAVKYAEKRVHLLKKCFEISTMFPTPMLIILFQAAWEWKAERAELDMAVGASEYDEQLLERNVSHGYQFRGALVEVDAKTEID